MRMCETNAAASEALNSRIGRARQLDIREAAVTLFAERGYHGTTMKDIGRLMGIRAPSLYNHVESKQEILRDIMLGTERELRAEFHQAIDGVEDVVESLRRAMEAFVLHHAHNRGEALIGNREVASLKEPAQSQLLQMRREYEHAIRALIEKGCAENRLTVDHPHLASFGMLEMGVSVARWFHHDGPLPAEEVARSYGELAIRMCGANPT
jgi:AcrR family transcriptional regulator